MTWSKNKKQLEAALAASMRLLVLIRESLRREVGGTETPLYKAVAAHANLCGTLLPDELRMTQAEVDKINAQFGAAQKLPPAAIVSEIKAQLQRQGIQVLTPDGQGSFTR